jgi:hypothetical protein
MVGKTAVTLPRNPAPTAQVFIVLTTHTHSKKLPVSSVNGRKDTGYVNLNPCVLFSDQMGGTQKALLLHREGQLQ